MGRLIKMQSFKDYKSGHITKEQCKNGETVMCEHQTVRDVAFERELDEKVRDLFDNVHEHNVRIAKAKNWKNMPHHEFCCCDKCAPTREDLYNKVREFNKKTGKPEYFGLRKPEENLAPSDCEPE